MTSTSTVGCTSDEGDTVLKSTVKNNNHSKKCIRCKDAKPIIVFRTTDTLCWPCYREVLTKKFKNNISKSRSDKRELETFVLALSGGPSSMVMLDLIDQCIGENVKRAKMFFKVHVVHIDQSVLKELTACSTYYSTTTKESNDEQSLKLREQIESICKQYKLPLTIVPLENIYGTNQADREQRRQKLLSVFNQLDSGTSKEDLLEHFRSQLIFETANLLGYRRVLSGSSSNRLAVRLLASTSKGRGNSVPNETNLLDYHRSITICHPMRDFLLKEIVIYHRWMKFQDYTVPSNPFHSINTSSNKQSINILCENFINTLQDISSQTVHTLLRSVDKLHSPVADESMFCSVCSCSLVKSEIEILKQKLDSNKDTTTTISTTKQSCCSTSSTENNQNSSSCCNNNNNQSCCSNGSNNNDNNSSPNIHTLCYSCRNIVEKKSSSLDLPPYIKENSKTMMHSYQLRNEIKDFLLNDEDDDDDDN